PSIVIVIDGYNEVMLLSAPGRTPGDMWFWPQQQRFFDDPLLLGLADFSMIARTLSHSAVTKFPMAYSRVLAFPPNARWCDDHVRNVEAMALVTKEAGARFAWSWVPLVYDRDPPSPSELVTLEPPSPEEAQANKAFQAELKRRVAESRARVAPVVRARGGA